MRKFLLSITLSFISISLFIGCSNSISTTIKDKAKDISGKTPISKSTPDGELLSFNYSIFEKDKCNSDHRLIKEFIDKSVESLPSIKLDDVVREAPLSITKYLSWETPKYIVLLSHVTQPSQNPPFKIEIISRQK